MKNSLKKSALALVFTALLSGAMTMPAAAGGGTAEDQPRADGDNHTVAIVERVRPRSVSSCPRFRGSERVGKTNEKVKSGAVKSRRASKRRANRRGDLVAIIFKARRSSRLQAEIFSDSPCRPVERVGSR